MKKLEKICATIVLSIIMLTLLANQNLLAVNVSTVIEKGEYSEEFKEWVQLPDEEKEKVIMPPSYEVKNTRVVYQNPLYLAKVAKASIDPRYSLKDVIQENLIIKDQMQTGSCWTFAALSSLETNMALYNYKNGIEAKIYDFSERHMEYATSRTFADGAENPVGYNRKVGTGGNSLYAESYLTNGSGAINENEMPFQNNEDLIDIREIQGKTIASQVYDTILFANYNKATGQEKTEIMNQIKQHIQNYGSVYASIHGDSASSEDDTCYNNTTGAKYCNDESTHKTNHAISIIGWDDNYSIDNFPTDSKPTSNGAWIVRNSWGERIEYVLSELKEQIFNAYKQQCIARGWNSAEQIPDSFIEESGYTIQNGMAYMNIGDNGLIYVSYEDVNIASGLWGVEKAINEVKYDNIYQYDEYYPLDLVQLNTSSSIIICNIFNKKTAEKEYLTQVALNLLETSTCKVYVNPNGTSKSRADLKAVELQAGESELLEPGYHTLEFAKPIEINANSFVVAIEIQNDSSSKVIPIETTLDGTETFSYVTVEQSKCFATIGEESGEYEWIDLGKLSEINKSLSNGDSSIKAFTTNSLDDGSLKSIEIVTPPDKTVYVEGENFDKTGMVVRANYNSKTNPSAILDESSYNIVGGTALAEGQTFVTITYENQSVDQPITVEKNVVTDLNIKTPPNKTEYKEGQHFDKTGMVVEAIYQNGDKKEIEDYTIVDGYNLKADQIKVTILYNEKMIEQPITVTPNPLVEIKVTKAPNKVKYFVGENFDKIGMIVTGTYQDGDTSEIIEYIVIDGENLKREQAFVTIAYEEKTTTQEITVEDKVVQKISINKLPNKTQYIQNKEQLDLTGGTLKVVYDDGSNEEVSLKSEQVSVTGFNNKQVGKNTLTVTYFGQITNFDVEIIAEQAPENSNFDRANFEINSIKYYTFSNANKKEYFMIGSIVNGIVKAEGNDNYEYYYYLSTNQNENNITDWVKISENQTSNDELKFVMNTNDVKNFAEISNNENTYIYIKERVTKGGNQSICVSKAMKINVGNITPEIYLDGVKQNSKPEQPNNHGNNGDKKDNTTTTTVIPNAGTAGILIVIAIISVAGAIGYIRYRILNKYVK